MTKNTPFKCVNCGAAAAALFKTYGPSVLKLTKCDQCNGIVDKYIEYDLVIVMIDMVLVSREAQRHVIYNTEFKAYWKLFMILILIETYGLWQGDSLFNIVINTACGIQTNSSTLNITALPDSLRWEPSWWSARCGGWRGGAGAGAGAGGGAGGAGGRDLFIWEKLFYIQFLSTAAGVAAFILTVHCAMKLLKPIVFQNKVDFVSLLKAFSLAHASILLTLPMLVWGAEPEPGTRVAHTGLVFLYSYVVFLNMFIVLYGRSAATTALVLAAALSAKFLTTYHVTPALKELLR